MSPVWTDVKNEFPELSMAFESSSRKGSEALATVEVGLGPDWVAVGQSAGLTGLKSPAATEPPEDAEPPEDGGAAVAVVLVAAAVVVLGAVFFVVAAVVWVAVVWVDDGASAALLEAAFLHDLRPSDARGMAGTSTGCSPRGLSWRRRMPAWWAAWPWEEASASTTRARTRAEMGSWKSMVKSGGGCSAARGLEREGRAAALFNEVVNERARGKERTCPKIDPRIAHMQPSP
ncbi:hypothetical protein B0H12DRAFT_778795 [Mycena haematopus]|nr:hypothetical protein B0H12DRAFT_778795 [Mycena haematopus]